MSAMQNDELEMRVRALRAKGASPKEIARALGIPRAKVVPLVRVIAAEDSTPIAAREIVGCWLNTDWSDGLTFDSRPGWPTGERIDADRGGLVTAIVVREDRRNRVSACVYLVDTFCLGVKNTVGPRAMDRGALHTFTTQYFDRHEAPPVEVPLELVQHLVLGAVDYARALGFSPHRDFSTTADHLGAWTGPSAIRFGRDGMPFYVQGPYDNPTGIMRTLERTAGSGNFHYLVQAG